MKCSCRLFSLVIFVVVSLPVFSQTNTYILNGAATQNSCNCYTLTTDGLNQSGSVWNATKIDLRNAFDFTFNVYLGCKDGTGADGIVFMLQPVSTSLGAVGGGMGFSGVVPSIGITLDTWQNTDLNDPVYDHISIQANGNAQHTAADLAPPVPASSTSDNIEDCKWHTLRISWDPPTTSLMTYFDGVFRAGTQYDLIGNVFNNDPMVYWGFSAATGGSSNLQQFCTALNPNFSTATSLDGGCSGVPLQFTSQSESFAPISAYYWDFGDGTTSTQSNPPPHIYSQPGIYTVKLAITGLDGCQSDTMKKEITIGSVPNAGFEVNDTCLNKTPTLSLTTTNYGVSYEWLLNGNSVSTSEYPSLDGLTSGSYQLQQNITSLYGCGATDHEQKQFAIKPLPLFNADINNGCVDQDISFEASQLPGSVATIIQWNWLFSDGTESAQSTVVKSFDQPGNYEVQLWAVAANGCISDTLLQGFIVNKAIADAGNDTLVIKNDPFQLNGSGNGTFLWTPSTDLNDNDVPNPTGSTETDHIYTLTVTTAEGCVASDAISVEVFKGSAVYVPTGFTPNNDGLNDLLIPKYIGIKKLFYFTIYNRWGQQLFSTNNLSRGWDGTIQNVKQATGTFVWMLKAEDYAGKLYQLNGTVTVVR